MDEFQYDLALTRGNSEFWLMFAWKATGEPTDALRTYLKQELIRVAESMIR